MECVGANNSEMTEVLLGKAVLLTSMKLYNDAHLEIERGLDVVDRLFGLTHYKKGTWKLWSIFNKSLCSFFSY
jgi:hypothetical protein